MFIINFNFIKPMEEVNSFTALHREYVSKQYKNGTFIIGGPRDPRNGGVVIANSNSEKELCEILEKDPLIIQKVAEYSLTKFNPLMSTTSLDFLLNESK